MFTNNSSLSLSLSLTHGCYKKLCFRFPSFFFLTHELSFFNFSSSPLLQKAPSRPFFLENQRIETPQLPLSPSSSSSSSKKQNNNHARSITHFDHRGVVGEGKAIFLTFGLFFFLLFKKKKVWIECADGSFKPRTCRRR